MDSPNLDVRVGGQCAFKKLPAFDLYQEKIRCFDGGCIRGLSITKELGQCDSNERVVRYSTISVSVTQRSFHPAC